jgi:hypothetical protein
LFRSQELDCWIVGSLELFVLPTFRFFLVG